MINKSVTYQTLSAILQDEVAWTVLMHNIIHTDTE